jgi:hypothetical protein
MTQSVHYTRVMDFYSTICLQNYCVDQTLRYVLNVLKAPKEWLLYTLFLWSHDTVQCLPHEREPSNLEQSHTWQWSVSKYNEITFAFNITLRNTFDNVEPVFYIRVSTEYGSAVATCITRTLQYSVSIWTMHLTLNCGFPQTPQNSLIVSSKGPQPIPLTYISLPT